MRTTAGKPRRRGRRHGLVTTDLFAGMLLLGAIVALLAVVHGGFVRVRAQLATQRELTRVAESAAWQLARGESVAAVVDAQSSPDRTVAITPLDGRWSSVVVTQGRQRVELIVPGAAEVRP